MQRVESDAKPLPDRHDHRGEQRGPVGIEQGIEGAAETIIAQMFEFGGRQPEQARREADSRFSLPVDGLALDDDRAQQHTQRGGMRERAAAIGGGDELFEQRGEADALEEVIDQR